MKKRSVNVCGGPLPKTSVSGVHDHSVENKVRGNKVQGNNVESANNVDSGVADPVPYETQLQGLVNINGHDGVATYDEVKLAAKRGGLVYVTPEYTWTS